MANKTSNHHSSGPVFDFGPGWGAKTKKWLKRYVLASDCALCRTTRYVMLVAALIIIGMFLSWKHNFRQAQQTGVNLALISESVKPGDSKTSLARRALADYLAQHVTILTPGQKIFIETNLAGRLSDSLTIGGQINFAVNEVLDLINQAQNLSTATLNKWQSYANKVRF